MHGVVLSVKACFVKKHLAASGQKVNQVGWNSGTLGKQGGPLFSK